MAGTQSNMWFAAVPPGNVPTPSAGYYAFFVGDGSGSTTAGTYYKKDSAGTITALVPAGDPAGTAASAAAAAQAASQPLDSDLTAIAALSTSGYGRALLTVADSPTLTALMQAATTSMAGLMSAADKQIVNNRGVGIYNVLDYGISTNNTGAVNLAAWNALMTTVVDNATVFFPPGPMAYQFSDVMAIPSGKHLRVEGTSNRKSMIQTTNATAHVFSVGDWYNEFRGLRFSSSVTRTGGAAIYSGNNVALSVYDCDFVSMYDGIVFSGGVNAGNLSLVSNCGMTGMLNRAIVLDGQNANTIIEKVIVDGTSGVCQVGLELVQCGSVLISNCDFIRSVNNCRFNPASGTSAGVFSAYFVNTFFDTSPASSVLFTNTGFVQRVKFVSCWFSGSVTGCEFASTAATLPTAIDFVACDIFGNSSRGIYAHGVQDFSVGQCRISGNATAGVEVQPSAGAVTRFNIQNNAIKPTGGFGANGTGVLIGAGTFGAYAVTGNDVQNNTVGISDGGTVATFDLKIVGDNLGHLVMGSIGNLITTATTVGTADTALLVVRVPANAVSVGSVFQFKLLGISSAAGTLIFRVHVGPNGTVADPAAWQSITSAAQVANQRAGFDGLLTVRSVGAGGTVQCEALGFAQALLLPTLVAAVTTPAAATTAPWFITLSCTASAGAFVAQSAVVEAL